MEEKIWLCGECNTELESNQNSHVGWLECPNCGESYRTADLEKHAVLKKIVSDKKKIQEHLDSGGSIDDLDTIINAIAVNKPVSNNVGILFCTCSTNYTISCGKIRVANNGY